MKNLHSNLYGTSNATISLVGDFDNKEILAELQKRFGTWNNPSPFVRIANNYLPNPAGGQKIETPDKANSLMLAGINLKMNDSSPDYAPLYVANYLMGGGFLNSRLAVRLRQKDGISYGVGSQFSASPLDETGSFMTYAILAPENSEKAQSAIFEEINKVRNEGFTEDELAKAKEGLLQSRQVSRSKDGELAGKLENYLYLDRDMKHDAAFDQKLQNLTLEEVNNAFRKHIDTSKITIVQAGDFAKKFAEKPADTPAPAGKLSGAE
jgi:zinc protease